MESFSSSFYSLRQCTNTLGLYAFTYITILCVVQWYILYYRFHITLNTNTSTRPNTVTTIKRDCNVTEYVRLFYFYFGRRTTHAHQKILRHAIANANHYNVNVMLAYISIIFKSKINKKKQNFHENIQVWF